MRKFQTCHDMLCMKQYRNSPGNLRVSRTSEFQTLSIIIQPTKLLLLIPTLKQVAVKFRENGKLKPKQFQKVFESIVWFMGKRNVWCVYRHKTESGFQTVFIVAENQLQKSSLYFSIAQLMRQYPIFLSYNLISQRFISLSFWFTGLCCNVLHSQASD